MNYSLKQLVLPVFILIPFLSTQAVGDECTPTGSTGTAGMSLTVCPDQPTFEVDWPEDLDLDTQLPFKIRSCGDYSCNRATEFAIGNDLDQWDEQKINLINGQSKIPLTVEMKQTATSKSVPLPVGYNMAFDCKENTNSCDFHGSGLTAPPWGSPDEFDCSECVNFELHIKADLKDLITQKKLTSPGKHEGSFLLYIQQHIMIVTISV